MANLIQSLLLGLVVSGLVVLAVVKMLPPAKDYE